MSFRNEELLTSSRPVLNRFLSAASKSSLMSPSPSHEADDEHSSDDLDSFDMEQQHAEVVRYADEDTRPTSQREIAGWYSYGWAAEVFVICAMGSFLPITLEQLARDQGVLLKDKSKSCKVEWAPPASENPSLDVSSRSQHKELAACVISLLGIEMNTASFAMYTFSISVLVQALLIISMSGAADHGRFRKTFLLFFAFIGSVATMLFIVVIPTVYLLGALLAIVANTCFGASFVLLNSFLPLLVRYHPMIRASEPAPIQNHVTSDSAFLSDTNDHHDDMDVTAPLLVRDGPEYPQPTKPVPVTISPELALSTKISSYGIGIGYTAGLFVQLLAILIVVKTGSTTFSLRLVLLVIGIWWFLFSIPAAFWLRPRPGPPLPAGLAGGSDTVAYIKYAWKALFKTIGHARHLKDIVIFLAAWFLLSDSIATVSGTAVLFAKTNLAMKTEALALINVIATVTGVIGALYWSAISRLLNLRASQTIIACVCLFEIIPLYGLLGFIPAVQRLGYLGLQQPEEMYVLGAVYGFVLGGLSSYCRSFFGELIPPGFEAGFYALYAITDKGSSIFGPAIVGLITDRYGDIRPAFVFLAILIGLPLPLLLLVDVDRGNADAKAMAKRLALEAAGHGRTFANATTTQIVAAAPENTIHHVGSMTIPRVRLERTATE